MQQRVIDIVRQRGEGNLGEALIRLARLAESAHRGMVAEAWREGTGSEAGDQMNRELKRMPGSHPRSVASGQGQARIVGKEA